MSRERPEFLCEDCDWIGSPEVPPVCCPNCGSENLVEMEEPE